MLKLKSSSWCLLACAVYTFRILLYHVHSNFPLLHIVIMLFSTFSLSSCVESENSRIVKLSRLLYFNFSLCDITFCRTRFHFISSDICMLQALWLCVQVHGATFFRITRIRAQNGKQPNIEFSALFDVRIKLQRWKFNKLRSTNELYSKNSLPRCVNTCSNICEVRGILPGSSSEKFIMANHFHCWKNRWL